MARRSPEPEKLGQTLRALIGRFQHVDLDVMPTILARWPDLVGGALADRCQPEVVRAGVLFVRVPTGAFAQKISLESERILEGFADLGEARPQSITAVVRG